MNNGFFGDMFDFDGDGKLDAFERAADFAAFVEMTSSDSEDDEEDDSTETDFRMGTAFDEYETDEYDCADDDFFD